MKHIFKGAGRLQLCQKLILLLTVSLLACKWTLAQTGGPIEDDPNVKIIGTAGVSGTPVPFAVGASNYIEFNPGGNTPDIKNIIRLSIFEETDKFIPQDFSVTAHIKIEYGENASSLNQINDQPLTVTYTKAEGAKYNPLNYISFSGAKYVRITLLSYSPTNAGSLNLSDILRLENEMRVTRYYELQPNIPLPGLASVTVANPIDMYNVSWSGWPAGYGINGTQLEWTWLEDEMAPNYYIPSTVQVDVEKLFANNATRIDLPYSQTSYKIPLFYDGQGKLYYRVRAVNITNSGSRADGQWSNPGTISYEGHNNLLNWQVRTSFAEEGKLKSVMEYYDGSLRSRQTVTKENVNNTTVTAETFYDYEGRPAIQILPAPGINSIIQYQKNLNLFNGQVANQNPAEIFDLQPIASASSLTDPLQTTTGTAKYYSANNDEINADANKNIPDAEGYPYTVTRYTPDGTGRIMAQSGVGPAHKMSSGRETKYYYGSAGQEEIDGLFGTEVGDNSHYFKNMVKDANGQMSVSYTDMHGRTIATALAGNSPGNLLPLNITDPVHYPNQAGTTIQRNLLNRNTNIEKGNSVEAINTLLVPMATNYQFHYELNPEVLQLNGCAPNTSICYDCMYDLEFSITDESGESAPIVKKFTNVTLGPDDDCNTEQQKFMEVGNVIARPSNIIDFSQVLQPGSYSIRKTLTISEASLQTYKAMFLTPGKGICKTEQEIIDSVYTVLLSTSDCNTPETAPCQACRNQLGTLSQFQTNYLNSLGNPPMTATLQAEILAAYNNANENCNRICNEASQTLSSKRQLMLADMMPYGGQYATDAPLPPLVPGSGTTMFNKYNIFSTGNSGQPIYKYPWNANKQLDYYRNDINAVDESIHPGGTGYTQLNATTLTEFAQQFVNSWANALLPHHPEYDRLVYAEANLATSYNWIHSFLGVDNYLDASNANYIMTNNATLVDPFYTVATGKKAEMVTWISSNYAGSNLSLWQIARGDVKCKNITDPNSRLACYNNSGIKVPPFADVNSTADKNQMWKVFRNLYASARDNQLNSFVNSTVPLADDQALINQGFQLRFGTNNQTATQYGWTWYPNTLGGNPILPSGFPQNATSQTYTSRCESYIQQWRRSLLQCQTLANMSDTTLRNQILDEITAGMESVCIRGSDASNPYGSSTVAVHTNGLPDSFEEVIDNVYQAHNIYPTNKDYYCNPYVIEFPKPHGKNPKFTKEYTNVVDSCNCAQFGVISSQAALAGYNPALLSSINVYLQLTYQDTLTNEMHQALLNCSSYNQWVCDSVQQVRTVSCYDPEPCITSCAFRQTNIVKQKLIGSRTSFAPLTCADFKSVISCFYDYYASPLPNTQPGCQASFVTFFNTWGQQTNYTWNQLDSIYYSLCGGTLNVCVNCTQNVLCMVDTNCHNVFVPYSFSTPQPLPDFLKCGYVKPKCLTCDSMVLYTSEFKTKFDPPYNGGPVFTGTDLTTEQINQNILYSRFLNFRTGFQYTWLEYAQAAATSSCNPTAGGGGVVDLVVNSRSGNTPVQYIASNSITFDPGFESGVNDLFETLIQPNGGGGGGPQVVICPNTRPLNDTTGIFVVDTPCHRVHVMAIELGQEIYHQQLLTLQANFERAYRAKCMAAKNIELFNVTYLNKEYHYTLYYYDQAGSLVKTVPPKGVHPDYSSGFLNSVAAARATCQADENNACSPVVPTHTFTTEYRYNSLGQVVAQQSPDGGLSHFWYDRLGRLVVSQNAQQALDHKYSYTLYDALGRITEVGQKPQTTSMTQLISQDDAALNSWITTTTGTGGYREQITMTGYDVEFEPNRRPLIHQQNLRNRVSYTAFRQMENDPQPPPYYTGTLYTYDIHGNVDTLLQDYSGVSAMSGSQNSFKRITYKYDLVSGKVNMVSYQPDWYDETNNIWMINNDKFFHKYKYDAENRLTEAWTSRDKLYWERDAAYSYYKYGPLSRTVIGQQQVQGMDYAYTIQGWLKGVNSTSVGDGTYDIGKDGLTGSSHAMVARDIYGFGIHYFDNGSTEMDYKAIGGTSLFARPNNNAFNSLYNGNIGAMSVNNAGLLKGPSNTTNALPLFYNYRYDQLNRIKSMNAFSGLANNIWQPVAINDYAEAVSYDPNGNILTYNRKGSPSIAGKPTEMDDLAYNYIANKNQLRQVTDNPAYNSNYTEDIDNQTNSNNYTYDAIGNLKTDAAEGINNISWTVYGKIASISKDNGTTVSYTYDASGNRITKSVLAAGSDLANTTIYVRDAKGSVLSIYEKIGTGATEQTETNLYGSSRIGILAKQTVQNTSVTLSGLYGNAIITVFTRGEKSYELSNHLGNVLATISDKKIQVDANSNGLVDYYTVDMVSATDYYPFGMEMPGRKYGAAGRYGFNGKERDKNINSLTAYDYGFRIYNPAIGRFLSVDPLMKSYPWYSPYHFAGNTPIQALDMDGLEPKWFNDLMDFFGAGSEKVNSEAASTYRLATGQSGDAMIPTEINGHPGPSGIARNIMADYQYIRDYKNASDYFLRPYQITNETASLVFPEAQFLQGGYDIYNGDYATGTLNMAFGSLGTVVKSEARILFTVNIVDVGIGDVSRESFYALEKYGGEPSKFAGLAKETVYNNAKLAISAAEDVPYIMTTVVDEATGKVYTGTNKGIKSILEVDPDLLEEMPKVSLEKWTVFNCAECDAINKALKDGAKFSDIKDWHTVKIKDGVISDVARCENCKVTTKSLPKPTSETPKP